VVSEKDIEQKMKLLNDQIDELKKEKKHLIKENEIYKNKYEYIRVTLDEYVLALDKIKKVNARLRRRSRYI
jgi:regulator of replication initiation timing